MGWQCVKCGQRDNSDNLNFPMMHNYRLRIWKRKLKATIEANDF